MATIPFACHLPDANGDMASRMFLCGDQCDRSRQALAGRSAYRAPSFAFKNDSTSSPHTGFSLP
jgi:hypothetical protein